MDRMCIYVIENKR